MFITEDRAQTSTTASTRNTRLKKVRQLRKIICRSVRPAPVSAALTQPPAFRASACCPVRPRSGSA